jgi:bifunctional enzyme CysN/CysC
MNFLETVYIGSDRNLEDFRFPVQLVLRPNLDFRGFAGTIASGIIRKGDEILALPSRKKSRVKEIITFDGNLDEAFAPQSVTLTLEDEIDISRGDMIVRPGNVPNLEQKFDAMVVWMSEQPLIPGGQYLFKQTTKMVTGTFETLRYQIDVNTMHRQLAPTLELNQIGRVQIGLNKVIAFDRYRRNKNTGAFIVIDRITNVTVGAGMILDRRTSENRADHWDVEPASDTLTTELSTVTAEERMARYGQRPVTILMTGLPGAGKTTTAYGVERALFDRGRSATVIDGQNIRSGLNRDLGFSNEDRSENLRRAAEVARLMNKSGLICLLAMIAPNEEVRNRAAEVIRDGEGQFLLVHLTAPPRVCAERNLTARESDVEESEPEYQPPVKADLVLETDKLNPVDCVKQVIDLLEARKFIQ